MLGGDGGGAAVFSTSLLQQLTVSPAGSAIVVSWAYKVDKGVEPRKMWGCSRYCKVTGFPVWGDFSLFLAFSLKLEILV